jgi:hypothetical protein
MSGMMGSGGGGGGGSSGPSLGISNSNPYGAGSGNWMSLWQKNQG